MAYAVKYLFKFQSSNGTVREIRVLKDGYSGDVIQRPLGRAPVIKKEKNGGVHGTSLTFYAECHIDREYIEFYTSDPKEYRVDVYAGSTLLWQGYITPELYSEPDIAPPYDVQVVATDGVGELKLYDFAPQGTVTLRALLTYLLGYTGLTTDVNLVSSLKPGSRGAGALLDMQICVDYLAGKTCYEALTYILTTLHATITRWGGAWVLVRETNVTFTSDKVRYFNTSGNSALLTGSVQTLGAMRAAPAWPVGQLSTVIDPAKNKVVVQAPWHPVTGLTNSDMTSDTGWSKSNGATYSSGGYLLPNPGRGAAPFISQTLSMAGLRTPMSFELRITGVSAELGTRSGAVFGVLITYTVGSTVYLLRKGDEGTPVWQQGTEPGPSIDGRVVDYQQPIASFDADRIQAETLSIEDIPAFVQGTSYPSGTLKIYIVGDCALVYGAHLDVVLPKGYQDVLRIDNGARGEGDSVEIAIGRVTSEVAYYQSFLQGLLLDTGSIITAFSDANFTTAMDYLALISRDYALSAALPRALAKGTVYLESSIGMPPLVFAKGGLNYWLETWSWDLYEDELEIDARTLPSASLTVQSETILESDGSTVSASSSGSSGGRSSISPGGGVQYFEPHNDGIILKADYDYVSVPDVLLGDDEESLTSLLAVIAGNAAQGAAAYGYFTNGVLGTSHLPALYLGTTQIQTSSAAQAVTGVTTLTMSGKLTIGGAEIEWVPAVGTTPGYLKINSALLTDGDQIVGGGTPGGGGGGGASYLSDLLDVKYGLNPSADDLLIYSSSVPLNPDGTVTGPGWTTIAKSSVGRIYTGGTGITIGNDNTISVTANTYAPYNSAGYLPLTGGTLSNSTRDFLKINSTNASGPYVHFQISGTTKGYIGYYVASGVDALWLGASTNRLFLDTTAASLRVGTESTNYVVYHAGNLTKSVLTTLLESDSGYYVKKSGDTISSSSYVPLTLNSTSTVIGMALQLSGVTKMNVAFSSNTIGAYIQNAAVSGSPYVNLASDGQFKYSNNYVFYHSGNSNSTSIGWNASTIALGGTTPIHFYGAGSGTYNMGVVYCSTNGWTLEAPKASDSATAANVPIKFGWRGGTAAIYVDASANVGIGTTSPSYKLHVSTASSWAAVFNAANAGVILAQNDGHGVEINSKANTSTYNLLNVRYNQTTLHSGGSTALLVRADGNVGIGTGSPGYKLEVSGTSGWTTRIISTNSVIYAAQNDGYGFYVGSKVSSSTYYLLDIRYGQTTLASGGTSAFYVRADGNVGVGTSSPGEKLEVAGNILINASGYTSLTFADSTQTRWVFSKRSTQNHLYVMRCNSSQTYDTIMAFDYTNGYVGIGTGSPSCKVSIAGTSSTAPLCEIEDSYSGQSWGFSALGANTTSYNIGLISGVARSTRNSAWYGFHYVSSGSTSNRAAIGIYGTGELLMIYPSGVIQSTGDQVISSDITLKENIEDLDLSVEQIAQMPAVNFEWKDGRGKSFGTIAQSVKPLFPLAVLGEEGNYTVAYAQGGWVFGVKNAREIVSLKSHETEQDKEIKKLKARVKDLEAEVQRLRMN